MAYTRLLAETRSSALFVALNRPEVHNAFDEHLVRELTECFTAAAADPDVRAVVLSGAGGSFCAGADLGWMGRMAAFSYEENVRDAAALQQMFRAIAECPRATIARVHGAAIGGGAGLVAACDIAIAAPEARFALSEVRLGLVPAIIGPYVLERVGMGAARALFVTGERISAEEALRIGLIREVTPAGELDAAVEAKLELIRSAGPHAIAAAKRLLREIAHLTPEEAAGHTVPCIAEIRASPEGREGIQAFLEKRKPRFAP